MAGVDGLRGGVYVVPASYVYFVCGVSVGSVCIKLGLVCLVVCMVSVLLSVKNRLCLYCVCIPRPAADTHTELK